MNAAAIAQARRYGKQLVEMYVAYGDDSAAIAAVRQAWKTFSYQFAQGSDYNAVVNAKLEGADEAWECLTAYE